LHFSRMLVITFQNVLYDKVIGFSTDLKQI